MFEATLAHGICTSKRAFFMAKQFRFDEIFGNRRHIEGNKRLLGTRTMSMQSMSDQFFTGSRFTVDQYRNRRA
ncbi:Uncharacterised protein [Vibrio cholerae]|nr:Uncharacterised protein [Vibrio cholerae]CSD41112.1 Uncharacterised protein [Vibrio cholerae]CSI10166.1 Uncharacterised protein [Vibrio cholerae]